VTPEVQYGIVATLSAMIFVVGVVVILVMLRDLKKRVSSAVTSSRPPRIQIEPKDNPGLLLAAMRTFEGTGRISFHYADDGLSDCPVPLTRENIDRLWKRITWEPEDDFSIPENDRLMRPANFVHVEISVDGHCVFGAWDNFDEECVIATDEFPLEVLDRLVAEGTIRSYTIDTYPYRGRYWHAP